MDRVTQDSYEKRHRQSTIPTAVVKVKEIKQEPIQKIQTRQKQVTKRGKIKPNTKKIIQNTKKKIEPIQKLQTRQKQETKRGKIKPKTQATTKLDSTKNDC